jgi:hypothetical protein
VIADAILFIMDDALFSGNRADRKYTDVDMIIDEQVLTIADNVIRPG